MKNSLRKNAAFHVLYRTLNVIFPLISAAYISRVLEPGGIGKVAYAQNIVSYFVMFAALGIPAYGTREMARKRETPEGDRLFSELVVINALSTAVCLGAYYGFVLLVFDGSPIYLVFGLELAFHFLDMDWFYQGREEYAYIALRSILVKALSLLALFALVKDSRDHVLYALILCLGTGVNSVFNVLHPGKRVKLTLRGLNLKRHRKSVLTLMLSSVTASLYCRVDTTMLGWLGTSEAVGFYTNAHKVVSVILTLVTSVSAVFLPRLSYVYQKERENYAAYLTAGLKNVLLLALPGCFGLLAVAEEVTVVLFGQLFAPAAETVRILAVLILIKGVGDLLCYQAIISAGKEDKLIAARVLAGMANVVLNALLIPRWGQNGAALASVVSELTVNGVLLRHCLKVARPAVDRRFPGSVMVSTAAMLAVVLLLRSVTDGAVLRLALSVPVGAAVYFATALLLKNDVLGGCLCTKTSQKKKK